ncbi:hypothetical protein C1752_07255 [Acaryochloris thomasi RCC1774]|uniref:Uncharacterized protein n=1 Tax=Acaryochloris thomasi RCC1774 TaxID=1764569 RepID=A0A2W1JBF9_9CYAN|nr:AAA-like domain-containing protein [Acaryochloris thomasi]PZD71246.1 hypothetical protein C1752_07255 [Acaryochloris thomasi RCC1774]
MRYQIGGSLTANAPSYIARQADEDLYEALRQNSFCYVLNARQMGKSSLLVNTRHRLQQQGYRCAVIDMTNLGSENISPLQWYKGIIKDLCRSFKLRKVFDFQSWWQEEADISLLQRFSRFIGDVLLPQFPDQNLVIFIDEIDSILSLPFSVDDFFALIRFCYNQRAIDPSYERINFAIFGVATPSDLICDRNRTPFNIGTSIHLSGFTLEQSQTLAQTLPLYKGSNSEILKAVLHWTNGQPFLTQKLCQLVIQSSQDAVSGGLSIPPGTESYWVEQIVQQHIISEWESQDEPEHLRTIRNRVLMDQGAVGRRLGLYQQIRQGKTVPSDDSRDQVELVLSGLVIRSYGQLQVKNEIYAAVFDLTWVENQLAQLRPYARLLATWVESAKTDESRLLRGQALKDAQLWSQGKRLSDLDYQFLADSVECDRNQVQQALEADRVKAIEAQLIQEKRVVKQQRRFSVLLTLAFLGALGLGGATFLQNRQARRHAQTARVSEVKALMSSAEGNFDSHRQLEALTLAISATRKAQLLKDKPLQQQSQTVLRQTLYGLEEANRLPTVTGARAVSTSPDGQFIVSGLSNGLIYLWRQDGTVVKTWTGHSSRINDITFSPDQQYILTASADRTVKMWRLDGTLIRTFSGHREGVTGVQISPDGTLIASSSSKQGIKLWGVDGTLVQDIPKKGAAGFSPDSQWFVTSGKNHPLQIWGRDGKLNKTLPHVGRPIHRLTVSPDGQLIAAACIDKTVRLIHIDGRSYKTFTGHQALVRDVTFSPDGQQVASVAGDKTVKVWQTHGELLKTFEGHRASVWSIDFTPDGRQIASASEDGTVRLWQLQNPLLTQLVGNTDFIPNLAMSADGRSVATVGPGSGILLWKQGPKGKFSPLPYLHIKGPKAHRAPIHGVAFTPDGKQFVTVARDGLAKFWDLNGTLLQTLKVDKPLWRVAFSADGERVAIATSDKTVKLWQRNQQGQFPNQPTQVLKGHTAMLRTVTFNDRDDLLASGSADTTAKIWHRDGSLKATLKGHTDTVRGLAFSPTSPHLISASNDNTLKLWQLDGTLVRTFIGHDSSVRDVAFHPDGKLLASASMDGTVKVWRTDGTLLRSLTHDAAVRSLTFSPDGQTIISAGEDQTVHLWNWSKIKALDELNYACTWAHNYLAHNLKDEQSNLCPSSSEGN